MKHRNVLLGIPGVLLVLAAVIVIPFEIPRSISAYGGIAPVREWVLLRTDSGQIMSFVRDNRTGAIEHYTMTQAERGDAMSFTLAPDVLMRDIAIGDTVGWISSPELQHQLIALEGQLAIAEAGLSSARTGEKKSLVDEAGQRLELARAAYDEQNALHTRQKALFDKRMISDEEYQLAHERLKQLRISVDIAAAQLASVTSGMKDEYIRERAAQVEALRNSLDALRHRMNRYTFTAPLSGRQRTSYAADTLLVVEDVSELLLMIPVQLRDIDLVRIGETFDFTVRDARLRGTARVLHMDKTVRHMNGRHLCMVTARIENDSSMFSGGMVARARIPCEAVSPARYVSDMYYRILE